MEVAWTEITCNQDPKFPRSALWLWRAAIRSGLYVPRENHHTNIPNNCLMFVRTDFWPPRLTTCKFSWGWIVKSLKGFYAIKQTRRLALLWYSGLGYFPFHIHTAKICQLLNTNLKEDSVFSAWRSRNLCTVLSGWLVQSPEGSENDVWCILIPVCAELSSSICIEQYWMAE